MQSTDHGVTFCLVNLEAWGPHVDKMGFIWHQIQDSSAKIRQCLL